MGHEEWVMLHAALLLEGIWSYDHCLAVLWPLIPVGMQTQSHCSILWLPTGIVLLNTQRSAVEHAEYLFTTPVLTFWHWMTWAHSLQKVHELLQKSLQRLTTLKVVVSML